MGSLVVTKDDLQRAIAVLFKRKGRAELTEKEFVLSASMDLRWFPPRDAQKLLQLGLETGLLEAAEGVIRPAFALEPVEIPREFSPAADVLDVPTPVAEDLFLSLVDAIVAHAKSDRKTVIASVNALQERMDLEVEVAALVAARKAGVDVTPWLPKVRARFGLP